MFGDIYCINIHFLKILNLHSVDPRKRECLVKDSAIASEFDCAGRYISEFRNAQFRRIVVCIYASRGLCPTVSGGIVAHAKSAIPPPLASPSYNAFS